MDDPHVEHYTDFYSGVRFGRSIVSVYTGHRQWSGSYRVAANYGGGAMQPGLTDWEIDAPSREHAHAIAIERAKQMLGCPNLLELMQYG